MAKKNKGGRKPKYLKWLKKDNLTLLRRWARQGYTDKELAEKMGIGHRTLTRWKSDPKLSDIKDAISKGKEVINAEVEEALIKTALGYDYEEEHIVQVANPDGSQRHEVKRLKKHRAPDTTALIFYLKNRLPGEYRDKRHNEITGHIETTKNPFDELSVDELRDIIRSGEDEK